LIKIIIVILLIGVVLSLMSGLVFLFKDTNRNDSKRTLYALGTRITLAVALLLTIFYGLYTGELRMGTNAPWHTEDRHESGWQQRGTADTPPSSPSETTDPAASAGASLSPTSPASPPSPAAAADQPPPADGN